MKRFLSVFLLSFSFLAMVAQSTGPTKKCPTCGLSIAKCEYRGKHPNPQSSAPQQDSLVQTDVDEVLSVPELPLFGSENGHEWVDLGLPSGTKWATCNVGASSPSDYGDYFAWGETTSKNNYMWETLRYRTSGDKNDNVKFSKYVISSDFGTVDGKQELDPSDAAAYVNWGSCWCMPTKEQFNELHEKCEWLWTTKNGHYGYKVDGPNGNSIFLPASGHRYGVICSSGSVCNYWSRSLVLDYPWCAYCIDFDSEHCYVFHIRCIGQSVRPVLAQ